MSGKKYKIYQYGQFLGHWCSTSAAGAIEKMSRSLYPVAYNVNFTENFPEDFRLSSKISHPDNPIH